MGCLLVHVVDHMIGLERGGRGCRLHWPWPARAAWTARGSSKRRIEPPVKQLGDFALAVSGVCVCLLCLWWCPCATLSGPGRVVTGRGSPLARSCRASVDAGRCTTGAPHCITADQRQSTPDARACWICRVQPGIANNGSQVGRLLVAAARHGCDAIGPGGWLLLVVGGDGEGNNGF